METFALPGLLPIRFILLCIAGAAIAVFLILLLIWTQLSRRSKGRKILPRIATAICIIAIGLTGYYAVIGNMNNTMALRNTVVHDYNVNILTFDMPKLSLIVNDKVKQCEMRSNDQVHYLVQCANPDGTWSNLTDLKQVPSP